MWEALKQLNSEPVVVLKKLKCVEDELKQYIQRKPSAKCEERPNDASKAASPLLTPAIGENSQPQSKGDSVSIISKVKLM